MLSRRQKLVVVLVVLVGSLLCSMIVVSISGDWNFNDDPFAKPTPAAELPWWYNTP